VHHWKPIECQKSVQNTNNKQIKMVSATLLKPLIARDGKSEEVRINEAPSH